MRYTVYLLLAVLMCSCTNVMDNVKGLFNNTPVKNTTSQPQSKEELKREVIEYNFDTSKNLLSELSKKIKTGKIREYKEKKSIYELYVGEYAVLDLADGENSYNVVKSPKSSIYDVKLVSGKLLFRSIYQGEYNIKLYVDGLYSRDIVIKNKFEQYFTENDISKMIDLAYNTENLQLLKDTVTISKLAFPENNKNKDYIIMLMETAKKNNDYTVIKNELEFLQNNIELRERDKIGILNLLSGIDSKEVNLGDKFLDIENQNSGLKNEVIKYLMSKNNLSDEEAEYLKKAIELQLDDNGEIKTFLGNWYIKKGDFSNANKILNGGEDTLGKITPEIVDKVLSGDNKENSTGKIEEKQEISKGQELLDSGVKSYEMGNFTESILYLEKGLKEELTQSQQAKYNYYLGMANYNLGKYDEAIEYLKTGSNLEQNIDKLAEMYYNIGIAYDKLGEEEQATKYLTYVKQNFSKTIWGNKSTIYFLEK